MKAGEQGPVTAEELMAQLEADPDWVARRDAEERRRREFAEKNARDAAPLRAALAAAGFDADSVADLYNRRMKYEAAVPILLEWLPKIENPAVKESIVRALTVRWARPQAAPLMLEELQRLRDSDEASLRFAVANALSEVADDSVFDSVVELARDRRYPVADRGVLVLSLANMRDERPRAIQVLREMLGDDVAPHAVTALGELRAKEARSDVESILDQPEAWIRAEAEKALRKIDRA
jgi:HEAT repeat protein